MSTRAGLPSSNIHDIGLYFVPFGLATKASLFIKGLGVHSATNYKQFRCPSSILALDKIFLQPLNGNAPAPRLHRLKFLKK